MNLDLSLFCGSGFGLDGNQVLHSDPDNRSYLDSEEARLFVDGHLKQAKSLDSDADVLRYASDAVTGSGLFVELGTYKGRTANFLAVLNPRKKIYTFDSYQGLPTDWDRGNLLVPGELFAWPKGEPRPEFLLNVELREGWFEETLPIFAELYDEPIAFLHVDSDIYESASQGLTILGPKIVEGTVILFDEFYNYPNFRQHEYRAFQEFLERFCWNGEYLAYNRFHEQVAVRIVSRS